MIEKMVSLFQYKLVLVMRNDLGLSPGKIAVQASHAAVQCALKCSKNDKALFKRWYDEGAKKVVVKAENLNELHKLKNMAERKNIINSLISDAGLTEIPPNTITCLGIGPAPNELIDKITGNLPLL